MLTDKEERPKNSLLKFEAILAINGCFMKCTAMSGNGVWMLGRRIWAPRRWSTPGDCRKEQNQVGGVLFVAVRGTITAGTHVLPTASGTGLTSVIPTLASASP